MLEIVVDESLSTRIATELGNRGRKSITVAALDLRGQEDGDIVRQLAERSDQWVLLTADDRLPLVWHEVIAQTCATIATIHPVYPVSYTENEWHHDVSHRWAHVICEQGQGTVRRYYLKTHRLWTPPRYRRRSAASGSCGG